MINDDLLIGLAIILIEVGLYHAINFIFSVAINVHDLILINALLWFLIRFNCRVHTYTLLLQKINRVLFLYLTNELSYHLYPMYL